MKASGHRQAMGRGGGGVLDVTLPLASPDQAGLSALASARSTGAPG